MIMGYSKQDFEHDSAIVDEAVTVNQSDASIEEKRAALMALHKRAKNPGSLAGAFEALELQESVSKSKAKK